MKVSIITPAYFPTWEEYINTKESIDRQTNKNFEWIIVSDGDMGFFKNHEYDYDSDILLKENYGPSVARNLAFQISTGDIITYVDMGDILNEDRIDSIIKMFTKYDIELLFSSYGIGYPDGNGHIFNHFDFIGNTLSAFDYIKLLEKQNISTPLGVAHTRKPFVEVGGFQRGIVCGEDGVLWRRMWQHINPHKILFSDQLAGTYFIKEDSQARTQRRFSMGGFAIGPDKNGSELDNNWFKNYNSKDLFD